MIFLNLIYLLPLSAQRYTGLGRGLDWGEGGDGNGIVTLIFLLSIPIIAGIAWLYFATKYKVKKIIAERYKYKPGIPLSKFLNKYAKFEVKELISNTTGNIDPICIFTNYNKRKTYVGFSPYLGYVTYTKIISNIKDYYIQKLEDLECYILCTEESEEYKKVESNEWPYYWEEECIKELLIDLNIKHNINNYDITEPHKK